MQRERPLKPIDVAAEPDELTCDQAAPLVHRFLSGDEDVAARMRLRAHLAGCASCRVDYQASVETLARLARAPRTAGDGATYSPRALFTAGRATRSVGGGQRQFRLTKFALPAFGLFAVLVLSGRAREPQDAKFSVLDGAVRLDGHTVAPADGSVVLARSQAGTTDEFSRARVVAEQVTLVIESSTAFAVERVSPLRVRLFGGQISFEGSAVVSTPVGVLEIEDASGTVRIDGHAIEVATTRGQVGFQDPRGRRVVQPGVVLRVDL